MTTDERVDSPVDAPAAALRAHGLSKSYGDLQALSAIDLEVAPGEILGILGPNGAGKTTLVEILEGLRGRDAGTVSVLGQDPADARPEWRASIGAVLQASATAEELTVAEMLGAHASYYPEPADIGRTARALGLDDLLDRRIKALSGGQRRRLDIALGVIGNPTLLFLDEPTTGLDPEVRHAIWGFVRDLAQSGTTVLLTTHYLEEAEVLADRVVVLVEGHIVARGTPSEVASASAAATVSFRLHPPVDVSALPTAVRASMVARDGDLIRLETDEPTPIVQELMAWAGTTGQTEAISRLEIHAPSLEESYLKLLQGASTRKEVAQ